MQSCTRIVSRALFCFLFLLAGSLQAAEGLIEEVSFQQVEGKGESVLFRLNGPHLPRAFAMDGDRPRVVFDFLETGLAQSVPPVLAVNGNMIQQVRLGRHDTKTRAVIDLVPGVKADFKQSFDDKNNTLSIQLLSPAPPAKQESKGEAAVAPEGAPPEAAADKGGEEKEGTSAGAGDEVITEKPRAAAEEQEVIAPKAEVPVPKETASTAKTSAEESGQPRSTGSAESAEEAVPKKVEKTAAVPPVPPADDEAGPAPDPLLLSVTFEDTGEKGEMVLFKLNGFYPPTVRGEEEGIPRVICEFAGTRLAADAVKDLATKGKYIQHVQVRQLDKADLVRVTLDLVPNKNYDLQQVFFKEDSLFVIIVNSYDALQENETAGQKN